MPPVRLLMLAFCLTKVGSAQSDNPLLGQWHCAMRETVKAITGKIIGSSVGETNLEFRGDQTALVTSGAESGKTILRLNGRWSGGPKKLSLQVQGQPNFTGSINNADSLLLSGSILDRGRNVLHVVEWVCAKGP